MSEHDELDDFIQKAVNKGYEESVKRYRRKIDYKISLSNRKRNLNKKKRKQERQNKRKGRL